jgi:phosphopantetheinyl transferase
MPLFKQFEIVPNTFLLIWEIVESEKQLLENLKSSNRFNLKLSQLKTSSHRKQFLSNLQLLNFKNISFEELEYNKHGKPELKNKFISMSHSFNYSAVTISNKKVGIDVEKFRSKISKISNKFISTREIGLIGNLSIENLTKVWTIKEAVYKAFGISGIDFKNNINIESINSAFTKAIVKINYQDKCETYNIEIIKFSQYICSSAIQLT